MDRRMNVMKLPASRLGLVLAVWLCFQSTAAASSKKLGVLPAGTSPDSVDFSAAEMLVLDRGTISVYSLPDIVLRRKFCGSGTAAGELSPRHNWDQTVRVVPGNIIAEDNDKIIFFSPDGRFLNEKIKPADTAWFDLYFFHTQPVLGPYEPIDAE